MFRRRRAMTTVNARFHRHAAFPNSAGTARTGRSNATVIKKVLSYLYWSLYVVLQRKSASRSDLDQSSHTCDTYVQFHTCSLTLSLSHTTLYHFWWFINYSILCPTETPGVFPTTRHCSCRPLLPCAISSLPQLDYIAHHSFLQTTQTVPKYVERYSW